MKLVYPKIAAASSISAQHSCWPAGSGTRIIAAARPPTICRVPLVVDHAPQLALLDLSCRLDHARGAEYYAGIDQPRRADSGLAAKCGPAGNAARIAYSGRGGDSAPCSTTARRSNGAAESFRGY